MLKAVYEAMNGLVVESNGTRYNGRYRVMSGTMFVDYETREQIFRPRHDGRDNRNEMASRRLDTPR